MARVRRVVNVHPAYSVILFTTSSGAGYGLLFLTALGHAAGLLPGGFMVLLTALTLALGLITAGLLASTLHLGHPERAIGAFSQWRTSWLSREGLAAVATYGPAGLLWLASAFGIDNAWTQILALLAALGAAATVYATGMIYASLRTIRQWHHPLVPFVYLALAAASGALLLCLILALFGLGSAFAAIAALGGVALAAILKGAYWRAVDRDPGAYTAEMATGLGHIGRVRVLDPPHTRPNYVMREMGYAIGRKHRQKLRRIAVVALFAVPFVLVLLALLLGAGAGLFYVYAVLSAALGLLVERWLFFAEADHVAMLYYGAERA